MPTTEHKIVIHNPALPFNNILEFHCSFKVSEPTKRDEIGHYTLPTSKGIQKVTIRHPYIVIIERSLAFQWSELEPAIIEAIKKLGGFDNTVNVSIYDSRLVIIPSSNSGPRPIDYSEYQSKKRD